MISNEKFSKKEHLLKSKDFARVYKKGLAGHSDGVILYCLANALEHNRLGFSIGSKNIKRATSRNRIRRLFKEIYRKLKGRLKIGFDIVIVVRKDISATISYNTASTTLLKLAKETGLIK